MEAIGALVDGLKAFEGTVLFVSHDRWFVSQLATRIVEVTPNGLSDFPGTFAEYLERCGDDHLDADAVVLKSKASKVRQSEAPPGRPASELTWQEQKKLRNKANSLPARRDKVLASIAEAEARKKQIAALYAKPGFFESSLKSDLQRFEREDTELASKIETLMKEWEKIESDLGRPGSEA
jgi:ABC-type sulfate/molybdate transport systems ATPase subunit